MVKSKSKVWFDVKNTIINILLEVLCPNRCQNCGAKGEVLCTRCKNYLNVTNPGYVVRQKNDFEFMIVGGIKEGILSDLIKDYKYRSHRELADILVRKVVEILKMQIESEERIILVPLPTTFAHIRERGFDHMKYLGFCLENELSNLDEEIIWKNKKIEMKMLLLRTNNKTQVGKSAEVRMEQAKSAYAIKEGTEIDPKAIYVLFDDVWTTGASMMAGQCVLRRAGVKRIAALVIMSNDYID